MPLVHFFETSFGRTYQPPHPAAHRPLRRHRRLGRMRRRRRSLLQQRVDRNRLGHDQNYLAPAVLGHALSTGPRDAVPLMARVRGHRMAKAARRERALGRRGQAETNAAVEAARGHAPRDLLRRFHRHSGFDRATVGQDSDGTRRRISPHQGKSEAGLGCKCARTYPLALARYRAELRCQLRLYSRRARTPPQVRPLQSTDDRAAIVA